MAWLVSGIVYCVAYVLGGAALAGRPGVLLWFRLGALLVPPVAALGAIVRRRREWIGCEWLFWATIALGLVMSAVGLLGWTMDAIVLAANVSWLGWYAVFALFGTITPLFALLSQPHRGPRSSLMATTAVDIAGIAVVTGFLYSRFVLSTGVVAPHGGGTGVSLLALFEFQQLLVCAAMGAAAVIARRLPWGATYRRLALGLLVDAALLTIAHAEIWFGLYRAGFVYDVVWILPFAFYAWAASAAPASTPTGQEEQATDAPARPWVVFGAVAIIPVVDIALRPVLPAGAVGQYGDLLTAMTVLSVLPLLLARLAVERSSVREADDQRRLLSTALEQADDLVLITDPAGVVEHANAAFCRTFGYQADEIVQMRPRELVSEASRADFDAASEAARAGTIWRGVLVHRRRDGTEFTAESVVVPLVPPGASHVRHVVAVERDVTNELQMREELIHRERLAAAGQLVAGVAHELNNPLQSILGFSELLEMDERRESVRADLRHVRREAERAAAIVRNLLSFVRRSPAARQPTDLNDLVKTTVALRAYEMRRAGIAVEETYEPALPPVSVNRGEIQQVLLNLILNAEQAIVAARGAGTLAVRTRATPRGVTVEVQDDGPGVPATIANRVFEPFFTTKGVGRGTGLGLSLALGISEAHGGALTLEPSPIGACFRLLLPPASAAAAV